MLLQCARAPAAFSRDSPAAASVLSLLQTERIANNSQEEFRKMDTQLELIAAVANKAAGALPALPAPPTEPPADEEVQVSTPDTTTGALPRVRLPIGN